MRVHFQPCMTESLCSSKGSGDDKFSEAQAAELCTRTYNDSVSNVQLLITVGLPMLALAFGMYLNDRRFEAINGRIDDLRTDLSGRLARVETAMDNLTSKLVELGNRVIRIEMKLGLS